MFKKFIDSIDIDDFEVLTDTGWEDITSIHKTIEYDSWLIRTETKELIGADNHIVILENNEQIFIKDLKIGDYVKTETGNEQIIDVINLNKKENMYDLTVNSKNHTYYTNGILSHNTTVVSAYLLHYVLFNEDKTVAVMANKDETAIEIMSRIKYAFENLPLWLQQGIEDSGWNQKSIKLENNSKIFSSTTSSSSISGKSINRLYIDEFAKIPKHIADQFITATYPVITSGKSTKIIITSTPLGMNHFYDFWIGAVRKKNNFYPIKVSWNEHPNRDKEWKKKVLADIGPVRWNQEFSCKFLGSSETLIDADVLETIDVQEPAIVKYSGAFLIYEPPIEGETYVLGVDTSKGTGKDSSVIQVLKVINNICLEEVAVYRNNLIGTYDYADLCYAVGTYYNDAFMMIESNAEGDTVLNKLWYDLEYEYICNCDKKGLGIRSTRKSKLEANLLLKEYVEKDYIKIKDRQTVYELSRYVEVKPNVFQTENDECHDDCVTSLLWAVYFIKTEYFDKQVLKKKGTPKLNLESEDTESPFVVFEDDLKTSVGNDGWTVLGDDQNFYNSWN